MLDLKNSVASFLKSEYAPDSSEGSARLPVMMMSCLGYYCNETGLELSMYVFYKTLGVSRRVEKKNLKI